uniref:Transient receptor potential channel pyrexia n=3 Tax=Lygus hesperus TaxID=30085 RepID=A0A146M8A7_LYGHE
MEELLLVEGSSEVINEKDSDGLTPLLRAVQRPSDVVVVQLIRTAKADVGIHLKDGSNILHYAVSESDATVLRYLSSLSSCKRLINEVTLPESNGMTPLHLAAENGNVEFTEILLEAGANPNLHTTNDPKGSATALHLAAKTGFRRTVEIILKYDACSLNAEDKFGWKPLHTACAYGHGKTAIVMIKKGADLSDEIDFHGTTKTAFDLMAVNVPRSGELLEGLLDSYIEVPTRRGHRDMKFLYNPSCAITLNFEVLLSANDPSGRQLTFLNSVVNSGNEEVKEILLHPLIEIFLHIKWEKLWKFFAILLFFYILHTLTLTAFCGVIFIAHYHDLPGRTVLQFTFLSSLVPIVLAEALQWLRQHRQYWNDHESWVKLVMILTSGTVGYGSVFAEDTEWIRHFSSFAILSSWIELLFLVSRFRYWGLDVLMFEKVIENVLTVLSKFMFLFLGFMFALMIHFEGAAPFANIFDSFFQSVIMVVELNYGGIFPESSKNVNALIGRFIYVCYMVFVALAMMNLTVGLAVSDIAALEKQGRVEKLVKRTSFLSFLETLVYNDRVGRCFPAPRVDKSRSHSFRSIDAVYTVYPNRPGVLPHSLKSALLLKVLDPEKTETLTTEHFDEIIKEVTKKVEKMSQEITALQKNEKLNA